MHIVNVLAPIMLILGLGALLGRRNFLGKGFIAELNKLTFWVALPALIFRASATAGHPVPSTGTMILVIAGATVLMVGVCHACALALRVPTGSAPTFAVAGFVGNLAYIGLPVLVHSLGFVSIGAAPQMLASAVVTMTVLTILNNALAVTVLQRTPMGVGRMVHHVLLNPIVLAGTVGLAYGMAGWNLPVVLDRALQTLGGIAVPAALLCIGGSLQHAPLGRKIPTLAMATVCKIVFFPMLVWFLAKWANLSPSDTRVVVVFAACPTAAMVYTLASQVNGDEELAAGVIAVSSLAGFASLAVGLILT